VGLYTLFLYALLTGLAIWALSDAANNNDANYTSCELEAQGKINAENRKFTFHPSGHTTVVVEDSTSYHCSFGLYTEELKFTAPVRYPTLLFNIVLFGLLVLASLVLLVGLCAYNQWFLIPWIMLMVVDIVRGIISTVFIFIYSHGNLARIATGIFFLGLQCLHISLLLIIVAKFQRIHNQRNGLIDTQKQYYDPRAVYPPNTLPYSYSPQQPVHRGIVGPGDPYPYSDYSPSQKDSRYYDGASTAYGTRY